MDHGNIDKRYLELAEKYMNGSITSAEEAEFAAWYNKDQDALVNVEAEFATDEQAQRNRILAKVWQGLKGKHFEDRVKGFEDNPKYFEGNHKHSEIKKTVKLWPRIAVAASIILVLGALAVILNQQTLRQAQGDKDAMLSLSKHSVPPGGNKATLTLANGKVITLSDAKTGVVVNTSKLTYNDGTEVSALSINGRHPDAGQDPAPATLNTIATPRGGQYTITLSDGTKVILNAASSLKYPATFANLKERKVELTGEAYFIVKHNAKQPFLVTTKDQVVEDIGTEFNINSYADESVTKTTLIEGSAKVGGRHPEKRDDVVLQPGQQAVLTSNGNIKVVSANIDAAVAWKEGRIKFVNANIESILRQASRWYNIEIVYKGKMPNRVFNGGISRQSDLSVLLKLLKLSGIKFTVEEDGTGKKLIVSP